jgi:hypothetical protein
LPRKTQRDTKNPQGWLLCLFALFVAILPATGLKSSIVEQPISAIEAGANLGLSLPLQAETLGEFRYRLSLVALRLDEYKKSTSTVVADGRVETRVFRWVPGVRDESSARNGLTQSQTNQSSAGSKLVGSTTKDVLIDHGRGTALIVLVKFDDV